MRSDLYTSLSESENSHWWFRARNEMLERQIRKHLPPKSSLLDVGFGTGWFMDRLHAQYAMTGIDFSPIAVSMAQERGLANVHLGTVLESDFAPNTFQGILLFDTLEHIEDDRATLRKIFNLLTPGGLCIITVPAYQFLWSRRDEVHHHKRRYTMSALQRKALDAGFVVRKKSYFVSLLFPLAVIRRLLDRWIQGDGTDDLHPSRITNYLFYHITKLDTLLLNVLQIPFGLSLFMILEKPRLN